MEGVDFVDTGKRLEDGVDFFGDCAALVSHVGQAVGRGRRTCFLREANLASIKTPNPADLEACTNLRREPALKSARINSESLEHMSCCRATYLSAAQDYVQELLTGRNRRNILPLGLCLCRRHVDSRMVTQAIGCGGKVVLRSWKSSSAKCGGGVKIKFRMTLAVSQPITGPTAGIDRPNLLAAFQSQYH